MQIDDRRAERVCRLIEWRPWPFDNPSLLGHCAIAFAGGWVVHQIPIFRGADGLGVGVPSIPQLDSDGRIKQRGGKRQYTPALTFEPGEGRERWRSMVLAALVAGGVASADELPEEARARRIGDGAP